ncbi:MAG: hypothetical protein ACRDT1_11700 [Micromonosporaceae bacterium]
MTVTPNGASVAPNLLDPARADAQGLPLWRRRVELADSVRQLEQAAAAEASDGLWRRRVSERLIQMRRIFAEHVACTEGASGLYAELLIAAPRLSRGVGGLARDHGVIARHMDALHGHLTDPLLSVEHLRRWLAVLLEELRQHQRRGVDLVYEAYTTDIGGET